MADQFEIVNKQLLLYCQVVLKLLMLFNLLDKLIRFSLS